LSVGEQKRISDISDQRSGGEEKRKAYTEIAEKKKAYTEVAEGPQS